MSFCLNPDCQSPKNPARATVCGGCGARVLLKDRYRAIATIGQGGFGRTFLAIDEDKPSKPRCVIKQFFPLNRGAQHLKKAVELFEQEAIRLEELGNHPQIPTLLAHFTQEQHQYLVQEFIAGKTLADVLAEQGALREAQIRSLLTSLLPVLDFIHAQGVIHRDIKPANIIAVPGSRILGPAKPADQLDWGSLLQALSHETAQGFQDSRIHSDRFSQFFSQSLFHAPQTLAIADYERCQQMATQFAHYARLPFSQRQYLVADASRLLYELRRKYERVGSPASEGPLVLVDFGAAKSIKGLAAMQTGTAIGSPEFIAPEQARGKAVFASDLYSLGVTCIHLLTGVSPSDLYDSHQDRWMWRQSLSHPVSALMGQILDRLIEPGLRRRYATALDVLRDLNPQPVSLDLRQLLVVGAPPPVAPLRPPAPAPAIPVEPPPVSPRPTQTKRRSSGWTCRHQFTSPGRVYAIALSPTAPLLVSSSGTTIKLWDSQTGHVLHTLTGHLDIVTTLAIAPDGKRLFSGSADKTIRLWELHPAKRLTSWTLHTDTVLAVAIAPDGKTLASSSLHDPIVLWDVEKGQERERLYGHSQRIETLAFSPDGQCLVSGSADASLKWWDVQTGKELRSLSGQNQPITALVFSPDGKTLASGSADGTVNLWSTSTHRPKRTLQVRSGKVNALVFTPDSKTLITASDTLQCWNARSGKELDPLTGPPGAICALAIKAVPIPHSKAMEQTLVSASWEGAIVVHSG